MTHLFSLFLLVQSPAQKASEVQQWPPWLLWGLDWAPISTISTLFVIALPAIVVAYYFLRLGVRRNALVAKIAELGLEPEYLRLSDLAKWREVQRNPDRETAEKSFKAAFASQFRGDNLFLAYLVPLLLLLLTSLVFVGVVWGVWTRRDPKDDLLSHWTLFAMGGALVYVYPLLVRRYVSLSLTPQAVYELVGSLWLSVFMGLLAADVATSTLQPVAAFVGSLLPLPVLQLLRRKVFPDKSADEDASEASKRELMEIIGNDVDLYDQLAYVGVRSVGALAVANPISLFVETDPNLVFCIDIVDQANLRLIVRDSGVLAALQGMGIRSAVDLMTQIYEELPDLKDPTKKVWRFLEADEPTPTHLAQPLSDIANAMKIPSIASLRNLMLMLSENPTISYLQHLWGLMWEGIDEAFATEQGIRQNDHPVTARRDEPRELAGGPMDDSSTSPGRGIAATLLLQDSGGRGERHEVH